MADDYIRKADAVDALDELRVNSLDAENGLLLLSGIAAASDTIESLKSADVTEITHGEWMSVPEMWGMFNARYYCSKCGNDAIINIRERYVLSTYCPHCGAKMDAQKGD